MIYLSHFQEFILWMIFLTKTVYCINVKRKNGKNATENDFIN